MIFRLVGLGKKKKKFPLNSTRLALPCAFANLAYYLSRCKSIPLKRSRKEKKRAIMKRKVQNKESERIETVDAKSLEADEKRICAVNGFESQYVSCLVRVSFYDKSRWRFVLHVRRRPSITLCRVAAHGVGSGLEATGMRHQGSVGALPRPRPSITTGQTHRDEQQTANQHRECAGGRGPQHIISL